MEPMIMESRLHLLYINVLYPDVYFQWNQMDTDVLNYELGCLHKVHIKI